MNFETALSIVNDVVAVKAQRKLLPPEIAILKGTWQGMTYEQMANSSSYSINYLMRDIGPKFWKLLSEILEENVNKNNLRVILEKLYASSPVEAEQLLEINHIKPAKLQQHDWKNAPDFSGQFYGRESELELLRQWTTVDNCRLIGLWGLSGAGKTVLMKKLAQQVQNEFEIVIWRSLTKAPTLQELIANIMPSSFSVIQERQNPPAQLIELMRNHSCLILLDGIETILQSGEISGNYRSGYENYREMFRVVGESSHKSCLILSSLENPGGIFQVKQHDSPIRSLKLSGLSKSEAKILLETNELKWSATWQRLVEYYQGNPAIIGIAIKIIEDLFSGNVEEFLAQKSLVFGEIDRLLNKSLSRLSIIEREILYWLASEPKPVSITKIQDSIPLSIYPVELIEALESLNERSLIQIGMVEQKSVVIIPPAIRELVTNQFIAQISQKFSLKNRQNNTIYTEEAIELNLSAKKATHLSQWLQNRFEPDWQSLEVIFAASARSPLRLRSAFNLREEALVKRFKQIQLDTVKPTKILLLAAIRPEEESFKICIQAQPAPEEQTLPKNLKLRLKNERDEILAEIESEAKDNFIQLPYFRGQKAENFKIDLALNSRVHEEEFII